MKNFVIIFPLALICILFSCKKASDKTTSAASIVGSWNWIDTYYDYPLGSGNPATPVNSGYTELLTFNVNGSYTKAINFTTTDSGTFSTGHGTYSDPSGFYPAYTFDSVVYHHGDSIVNVDYYKVYNNDSLVFSSYYAGAVGGGSKFYIKF
jgi:hypothetical protein